MQSARSPPTLWCFRVDMPDNWRAAGALEKGWARRVAIASKAATSRYITDRVPVKSRASQGIGSRAGDFSGTLRCWTAGRQIVC